MILACLNFHGWVSLYLLGVTGTLFANICCKLIISQMSNTRCELIRNRKLFELFWKVVSFDKKPVKREREKEKRSWKVLSTNILLEGDSAHRGVHRRNNNLHPPHMCTRMEGTPNVDLGGMDWNQNLSKLTYLTLKLRDLDCGCHPFLLGPEPRFLTDEFQPNRKRAQSVPIFNQRQEI